ncbi:Na(+) H(+) antiporter subunit F [Indibacter alkaliphilus LW1]|jgi:multicomponent Na+:H+ antiporter subunit F|uniref:Na(+) H(+) antiporter subunit F n=1 Tax=Indibacter alkaliphilus (strain CCUG 57479 / KCTC 22604 / LW1) TaxID=1189612 RepID=S2DHJ3_INDAL|nr:cation:proton antiporter [Indibacter alkaliphilus]EOZ98464.1 Na(+) H(+) antiporter subunit F [Indibacter alkaliphilus LW1]
MSLAEYYNYVILPILGLSIILVFIRFLKGPSIPDRVIALDMLILIAIGIIAVYSMQNDQSTFLDIAMLFALIAFLGTVAFAYFLIQRSQNDE